jgi:NADPH:quinone reductase-like Zn-dependent oxidoreductase
VPEGVSLAQASILPMTGLTALNALEIAALKKGQILAVSGGAGLLAQYAIAAAKQRGIKVIADAAHRGARWLGRSDDSMIPAASMPGTMGEV